MYDDDVHTGVSVGSNPFECVKSNARWLSGKAGVSLPGGPGFETNLMP